MIPTMPLEQQAERDLLLGVGWVIITTARIAPEGRDLSRTGDA